MIEFHTVGEAWTYMRLSAIKMGYELFLEGLSATTECSYTVELLRTTAERDKSSRNEMNCYL